MRVRRDYSNVGPLFIYLILSFLFFGRGLVGHLSDRYIGIGTDPGLFIFFLEWWKYVFIHHVNPFFTYLQWAPNGANLAWSTFIPLFGIAAIPLTATLGPVATFNLLVLLCPALAAWTAFLLCRYLSASFWAAVLGGYAFGFSPWMLAHLLGHLTVLMMFPAPLMVLVTLRRLNEEVSARRFAITFTILIVTLFLCWPEAVATVTLFGGIAIALAWLTAPQWRERLQALVLPTFCAYIASAIILSPYLYYFFAFGQPPLPGGLKQIVSVYPSNFLIPSTANLIGSLPLLRDLCGASNMYEAGAYIALPMIFIVVGFAHLHWHDWHTRLLVNFLVIVSLASLGPALNIPARRPIPLPWAIAAHLPLMDKALPARFSVYGFLVLGVILSLWLADDSIRKSLRVAGACGFVLFTLPSLSAFFWTTPIDTPEFFSKSLYAHYLMPGDNVLILPYAGLGNSNIWQVTSGFYFRMAGGYLGQPPITTEFLPYFPIVYGFFNLNECAFADEMLKVFLAQKKVNAIIVADEDAHLWIYDRSRGLQSQRAMAFTSDERGAINSLFATLGVTPVHIGGVSLYRISPDQLKPYEKVDPRGLEARIVGVQLDTLINAAKKYLADGHPPSDLNPVEAQRLKLLPPYWASGVGALNPRASLVNGLALSSLRNGDVLVGAMGARGTIEALEPIYKPFAKKAEVSPLMPVAAGAESSRWIILLEYDRAQLASAAARTGSK